MIETIRQGLQADGITVSISKRCRWFEVPRHSVYYRPVKAAPMLQDRFVSQIKAMIEENPSFGYRTVAHLLGFNKNTVQRVFQLRGWQVRKRPVGFQASNPVAALGGQGAQGALSHGHVPGLGGARWLDDDGAGHRLPQP